LGRKLQDLAEKRISARVLREAVGITLNRVRRNVQGVRTPVSKRLMTGPHQQKRQWEICIQFTLKYR
jgi:hypothetical protein